MYNCVHVRDFNAHVGELCLENILCYIKNIYTHTLYMYAYMTYIIFNVN